jgi:hypothetical protein
MMMNSTALPKDPPSCCMIRMLVLARGTAAGSSPRNAADMIGTRAAPMPMPLHTWAGLTLGAPGSAGHAVE